MMTSQSLWVRDRFLIFQLMVFLCWNQSQSLWVRDRFLIKAGVYYVQYVKSQSLWVRDRFLIGSPAHSGRARGVAIPLGQGQVFNNRLKSGQHHTVVAIPLGQGQVFNARSSSTHGVYQGRNPFGSGTGF